MKTPILKYELELIKNNKTIKVIKGTSKSFVSNFSYFLRNFFINSTDFYTFKFTDGTTQGLNIYYLNDSGLRVGIGSNNTPPSTTDFKLLNIIEEKLATIEPLIIESDKTRFSTYADFSYNVDKVVGEFGLSFRISIGKSYLIVRDTLTTPINLLANTTLRVRYNWVFPL